MASVDFRPEAVEELSEAHAWYLARNRRTADCLFQEVDAAVERIASDPDSLPLYDDVNRHIRLRTLPYLIVFRSEQEAVEILAFAHVRRRPGYWHER